MQQLIDVWPATQEVKCSMTCSCDNEPACLMIHQFLYTPNQSSSHPTPNSINSPTNMLNPSTFVIRAGILKRHDELVAEKQPKFLRINTSQATNINYPTTSITYSTDRNLRQPLPPISGRCSHSESFGIT
jgi:hypothetical protein